MLRPQVVVLDLALSLVLGCSGVGGAWLLRRRSSLSIRNLYPLAVLAIAAVATAVASGPVTRRTTPTRRDGGPIPDPKAPVRAQQSGHATVLGLGLGLASGHCRTGTACYVRRHWVEPCADAGTLHRHH
jgi:hypothetical protein